MRHEELIALTPAAQENYSSVQRFLRCQKKGNFPKHLLNNFLVAWARRSWRETILPSHLGCLQLSIQVMGF